MVDMIDYLFYSHNNVRRAYLEEDMFDKYYDEKINGKFSDILEWS